MFVVWRGEKDNSTDVLEYFFPPSGHIYINFSLSYYIGMWQFLGKNPYLNTCIKPLLVLYHISQISCNYFFL